VKLAKPVLDVAGAKDLKLENVAVNGKPFTV
jgi:hypothetical protein